jgi:deazaflavin-dependent oxidoreductase (nitroreductase family)
MSMSVPTVDLGRSVAHRIVGRVVVSPLGLRFGRDIASRLDPTLLRLTRGRVSCVWPFPAVVLTHVGAKSGKSRTSALVYFTDRGRVILIASNFGGPRNPAWYYNVEANPIVTLYGRGIRGRFMADEIYGAERDRLFQRAKDAPGPYGEYEQAAAVKSRYIPVIAFTPQIREHTPRSRETRYGSVSRGYQRMLANQARFRVVLTTQATGHR